jgi:hypothetical protein
MDCEDRDWCETVFEINLRAPELLHKSNHFFAFSPAAAAHSDLVSGSVVLLPIRTLF